MRFSWNSWKRDADSFHVEPLPIQAEQAKAAALAAPPMQPEAGEDTDMQTEEVGKTAPVAVAPMQPGAGEDTDMQETADCAAEQESLPNAAVGSKEGAALESGDKAAPL
eukprot:gene30474-38095_t